MTLATGVRRRIILKRILSECVDWTQLLGMGSNIELLLTLVLNFGFYKRWGIL